MLKGKNSYFFVNTCMHKGGEKIGLTDNPWRWLVASILFIIWIALSFLMIDYLETEGMTDWWILVIPIAIIWLVYIGIAYGLINEKQPRYLR